MTDAGILLMSKKRKIGGFGKTLMSDNVSRQWGMQSSEVRAALQYLRSLESDSTGPNMFSRHKVDGEGRLQHLFWCDGDGRFDYKLFGDVVALDTTYVKSKYKYPLVVFSGVNHHIRTTIFASAIIADETEETYVWLFEQFKEAMGVKSPELVIANDDIALNNAIGRVFPNAYHRLCAQHLLHNASSKIRNPMMTAQFKKLMLSDCMVSEFDREWHQMVTRFGLEDHSWVRDMYERRKMWATAFIRGRCFVGFKATSRCVGLYVKFGRLTPFCCLNMVGFLQQYHHHCLDEYRYKEIDIEYKSVFGKPVLQTRLSLERSASRVFSREVFMLFRPMLESVGTMKVIYYCNDVPSSALIYKVSKYDQPGREWHVHYDPPTSQLTCTCQRMENYGIPCDHIVHVMVYLDIAEMPTSLVLKRWSKLAKKIGKGTCDEGGLICRSNDDFNDTVEIVRDQIDILEDDDAVNYSNNNLNIKLNDSSDECGASFLSEDDDEDLSDVNDGSSFSSEDDDEVSFSNCDWDIILDVSSASSVNANTFYCPYNVIYDWKKNSI
ncbi:protein FAR1-RELATED SEQUENCE 5-like [Lotus japonicus]|uniref:protein FAR1-RELATED SEQUENCE 5-like n=1 Tax=Lotus japonicus TaxID=34305 RepID=UPI00258B5586|nr:protein FAR1-RELATED SEQUENCE 5-like [Lotus japonicus]